jgi:hypothetical protein
MISAEEMALELELKRLRELEKKVSSLRDFVDAWNLDNVCIDLLKELLDGLFGVRKVEKSEKSILEKFFGSNHMRIITLYTTKNVAYMATVDDDGKPHLVIIENV